MERDNEKEKEDDATGIKFSCLDVYSTRQGSLRLWAMFYSVFLLIFLGLYMTVGAVLNYNQADSDQRDMITNFRLMIGGRIEAHNRNLENAFPEEVRLSGGDVLTISPLTTVEKSRELLSDPRLLPLWEVIQPMVAMRVTVDPIRWRYHEATLPSVTFPPFAWDANLDMEVTFKIPPSDMLFGAQLFNQLPARKRPTVEYTQAASDNDLISQVWTITATFRDSLRAFRVQHDAARDAFRIQRVSEVLCEVRYTSLDVPATIVETDPSKPQFRDGRPALKRVTIDGQTFFCEDDASFRSLQECKDQVFVPHIHALQAVEFEDVFDGPIQDASSALAQPVRGDVRVRIRDLYQPKPYAPKFTEFGEPFFVGFSLLIAAIVNLVFWCILRFHVVIRNVRVNEGRPPMFYQGMLRFRGW